MSVDRDSKASQWTGVPSAVYKLDLPGIRDLEHDEKTRAVDRILEWMSTYENDHDGWVLTPSRYGFAMNPDRMPVDENGDDGDRDMASCIGNCIMPIRYGAMDAEVSRRCLLTCTDGAPFKERCAVLGNEWLAFSNDVFYHKADERRSHNELCDVLAMTAAVNPVVAEEKGSGGGGEKEVGTKEDVCDGDLVRGCHVEGPVILTCF